MFYIIFVIIISFRFDLEYLNLIILENLFNYLAKIVELNYLSEMLNLTNIAFLQE